MAMKKMSKWALLGAVLGALFLIMSAIRYYVLYPDMDKCLSYGLIGFLIIVISFLYNRELQMTHDIEAIEDHISDMHDRARERQERLQKRLQARREQELINAAGKAAPNTAIIMDETKNGTQ